jgi:hypothetical protein
MPSETLTSCWTSNDDGGPTSDNTLNKALRIMGCDTGPGGDHRAHGFRSTASTLLNEEGAFYVLKAGEIRCGSKVWSG